MFAQRVNKDPDGQSTTQSVSACMHAGIKKLIRNSRWRRKVAFVEMAGRRFVRRVEPHTSRVGQQQRGHQTDG